VGDDVVHLAGDPGAFGGRGECDLLVSFAFQPFRAVVQFGEVGAAGGPVQAEAEGGGDHSGKEDRVIPPAASREQEQAGDHGQLEQVGTNQSVPAWPPCGHRVQGDQQAHAVEGVGPEPGPDGAAVRMGVALLRGRG